MAASSGWCEWWRQLHPKRIEAVGIFIILVAALWETFALRRANDELTLWVYQSINDKLWHIFREAGSADPRQYFNDNANDYQDKMNIIRYYKEAKSEIWIPLFSWVRTVLFACGSLLVLIAKWREGAPKR